MRLLSVNEAGKPVVDSVSLLEGREETFKIDATKPFKLNAGTTGVCTFVYFAIDLSN